MTVVLLAPYLMCINWLVEVWPAQISLVNLCWYPSVQWSVSGGEERGAGLDEMCGGLGGVAVPRRSAASHSLTPTAMERHGSRRVQQEPGVGLHQAGSALGRGSALPGAGRSPGASGGRRDLQPDPCALLQCHAWRATGSLPASDTSPGHKQTHRCVSLWAERRLDGAAINQRGSNRQWRWIFWKLQHWFM